MENDESLPETAREIFLGALADCSIERAFAEQVTIGRSLLVNGTEAVQLEDIERIRIIAVGKASATMLAAVLPRFQAAGFHDLGGILIAPEAPAELSAGFSFFSGGHPLPNKASCDGARAALDMLHTLPRGGQGA